LSTLIHQQVPREDHTALTQTVRRDRIAAVYSGSVLRFADVLTLLGERLEVLHVL